MKIGVWIPEGFTPEVGGGSSYLNRLLCAIDNYSFDVEICYVTRDERNYNFQRPIIRLPYLKRKLTWKDRFLYKIPCIRKNIYTREENKRKTKEHQRDIQILNDKHIGFLFYPTQLNCEIKDFPFVSMNWDIGHWSTYAFPELCANGEYEERSNFYTNILPNSLLVCCESEAGKQELLRYTNVNEDKIQIIPMFAGNCINLKIPQKQQMEILAQYGLDKNKYFFYPAQFWAHKNHVHLLTAFSLFTKKYDNYKLVLVGADKGNLSYIKSMAKKLNIVDKIIFPGFVPQEYINTFYINATALTMVSFFGPTNMPPLEAMALGCPIIASDFKGHREQLGAAAIYINPLSVDSIVAAMDKMVQNRNFYIERIQKQSNCTIFTLDNAIKQLNKVLNKASAIRSTWAI